VTGEGVIVVFEPIKGVLITAEPLGYKIQQVLQLPQQDEEFVRGLLILDEKLKPHTFPKTSLASAISQAENLYMFTAWPSKGKFAGFSFSHSTSKVIAPNLVTACKKLTSILFKELVASQVWELQLPEGDDREILSVVSKNPAERVHSQGRVLADRSVMYKYINPNLVSIVSQVSDLSHKCESLFYFPNYFYS